MTVRTKRAHTHIKKISGMKTFWKKFSRRKRTHISVAVYIIICLTTLFLLFLPLVLILLLCCFQNMTEIDRADSRAGERLSAAFLIGRGGALQNIGLHFLRTPQLQMLLKFYRKFRIIQTWNVHRVVLFWSCGAWGSAISAFSSPSVCVCACACVPLSRSLSLSR